MLNDGVELLRALLPIVLLVIGCAKPADHGDVRKIEQHGLQVETPRGWTGGGAGGTYEFRSPDGTSRIRIVAVDGPLGSLKEPQLLSGTGATATSRMLPTSPTRIGSLSAERARFATSDGRVYDVVAVQTARDVVLVQTSVTSERSSSDPEEVERLFRSVRQSIAPLK